MISLPLISSKQIGQIRKISNVSSQLFTFFIKDLFLQSKPCENVVFIVPVMANVPEKTSSEILNKLPDLSNFDYFFLLIIWTLKGWIIYYSWRVAWTALLIGVRLVLVLFLSFHMMWIGLTFRILNMLFLFINWF